MNDKKLKYPHNVWDHLCNEVEQNRGLSLPGKTYGKFLYKHILPVKNNETFNYLHIDGSLLNPIDYHKDLNHLNSSQLLCICAFSPLIKNNCTTKELSNFLGLDISVDKPCHFEYKDEMKWDKGKKNEDTQFDFHISGTEWDKKEYFFEIKFTEGGFGTAHRKEGDYHEEKAKFYLENIEDILKKKEGVITLNDIYKNYQIIRNILRARDPN